MKLNVTCKICGEICANFKGLSTHLRKHNCEAKDYYDTYLKTDPNEGKCVSCGKETKFYRMSCGYYKHCSDKCSANDRDTREKCKNTNIKRYGYENPWNDKNEHKLAKEGFLKKYGVENPGQVPSIKKQTKTKYRYDNKYFDSSWELAYYIYLKDHNIDFEYHPNIKFEYKDINGKSHFYLPDFKVENEYQEIKGNHLLKLNEKGEIYAFYNTFNKTIDVEKYNCIVKNNIKLLLEPDCEKFIIYVINKYGKDILKKS